MKSKLISLLIAGAAAATVPACGSSGTYVVATSYDEPPPAPREEYVSYRPGYVWVHGKWVRDFNNRWRWQSGYFIRERAGYVYVPGRWELQGRNYIWIEGGWRAQGNIVIRGRSDY